MKLTIGSAITKKVKYRNVFVFSLEAMSGDGDDYKDVKVKVSPDNPFLEQFTTDMFKETRIASHEIEGQRGYKETLQFTRWFDTWRTDKLVKNPSYNPDIETYEDPNFISIDWPTDVTGYDNPCSYTGVSVTYYDENGVQFSVKVQKDSN